MGRGVLEHDVGPSLKDIVGNVYPPVNRKEECNLVLVDFLRVQSRDLTPCPSGIVPILEVLGSKDKCGQEHAPPTLESAERVCILWLFHGEVVLRNMRFN